MALVMNNTQQMRTTDVAHQTALTQNITMPRTNQTGGLGVYVAVDYSAAAAAATLALLTNSGKTGAGHLAQGLGICAPFIITAPVNAVRKIAMPPVISAVTKNLLKSAFKII